MDLNISLYFRCSSTDYFDRRVSRPKCSNSFLLQLNLSLLINLKFNSSSEKENQRPELLGSGGRMRQFDRAILLELNRVEYLLVSLI